MNDPLHAAPGVEIHKAQLSRLLRVAARSHIHAVPGVAPDSTAIYTLADPRDARCARYVGQTRDPRRRFAQHLNMARLWLPDAAGMDAHETLWWVRSPKHRPLYAWIRALHRDGGRLPFMWVTEWTPPGTHPRAAERAAIMRHLAQGAELLNFEARVLGAQLPLL